MGFLHIEVTICFKVCELVDQFNYSSELYETTVTIGKNSQMLIKGYII